MPATRTRTNATSTTTPQFASPAEGQCHAVQSLSVKLGKRAKKYDKSFFAKLKTLSSDDVQTILKAFRLLDKKAPEAALTSLEDQKARKGPKKADMFDGLVRKIDICVQSMQTGDLPPALVLDLQELAAAVPQTDNVNASLERIGRLEGTELALKFAMTMQKLTIFAQIAATAAQLQEEKGLSFEGAMLSMGKDPDHCREAVKVAKLLARYPALISLNVGFATWRVHRANLEKYLRTKDDAYVNTLGHSRTQRFHVMTETGTATQLFRSFDGFDVEALPGKGGSYVEDAEQLIGPSLAAFYQHSMDQTEAEQTFADGRRQMAGFAGRWAEFHDLRLAPQFDHGRAPSRARSQPDRYVPAVAVASRPASTTAQQQAPLQETLNVWHAQNRAVRRGAAGTTGTTESEEVRRHLRGIVRRIQQGGNPASASPPYVTNEPQDVAGMAEPAPQRPVGGSPAPSAGSSLARAFQAGAVIAEQLDDGELEWDAAADVGAAAAAAPGQQASFV